jgi:hypothetical protein
MSRDQNTVLRALRFSSILECVKTSLRLGTVLPECMGVSDDFPVEIPTGSN